MDDGYSQGVKQQRVKVKMISYRADHVIGKYNGE